MSDDYIRKPLSYAQMKSQIMSSTPSAADMVFGNKEDIKIPEEQTSETQESDTEIVTDENHIEEKAEIQEESLSESSLPETDKNDITESEHTQADEVEIPVIHEHGNYAADIAAFTQGFDDTYGEVQDVLPADVPSAHSKSVSDDAKQKTITKSEPDISRLSKPLPKKQTTSFAMDNDPARYNGYETASLRKVLRSLVTETKGIFYNASSQDDAINAFLYYHLGKPENIQVPDHVKELANQYDPEPDKMTAEDAVAELKKEINSLKELNRRLVDKNNAIELVVAYWLFDMFGFRKNSASKVSKITDIKLNESGITDLLDYIESMSVNLSSERERRRNLKK